MWVFMSDSFLSIVENPADKESLIVRARAPDDIMRVFPNAKVGHTPERDYSHRAALARGVVALAIGRQVSDIDYGNFKDSVPDRDRHDAYFACWSAMMAWGRRQASTKVRRRKYTPRRRPG